MTRTQEFIKKNRKLLTSGPDFYNPDTSLMSVEDYEKAKCRMLVIFPTPHVVKTVSSTAAALNDFVIEHCPDTFIDFAYMPENEDIKRYDDWNVPYAIGNITHLDPSHFDIVGFSISVLHEVVTGPAIMSTFDRCDKPIPLFWSQRKDMKIGTVPLVYAGGITAACGESMFGKVNVGGKEEQGYMDFVYLGDCGHTHHITNRLIEAIATGKCHRSQEDHDIPGYPHSDVENFTEVCEVKTMQDFVDALFDMQEIYQPQAYEVEYNKHNRIIKNIKINPKAQDFVKPYYPHEMPPDLGIGRTIINASGDNCGTTQTQVSEGAHMKGNRIRTLHGLVRVEDLCSKEIGDSKCTGTVDTISGPGKLYHRFTQGVKPVRIFTLKSGIRIGLTDEHPVEQWHIGDTSTEFVRADQLSIGDFFMTKKSHVFGSYPMTPDEAEFLGRMVGDGSYNLYNDSREGHDTPTHKMYLSCAWSEKDYCIDLLKRAGINYKLDETQGRHCRFWIKETDNKGRSMRKFWGFNQFYKQREGKPSVKYIPAPAYQLTEYAMKSFLKGYHDADGCTSTKKGLSKVTFDCCHESIIDDIQQFLLMVGIPTRKHFNEKSRIADEEYGFYDTVNEHWSLQVSSEYFDKFNALGVLKQAHGRNTKSREHLPISDNIRELLYNSNLSTEERSKAFAQVRRNSFTKYLADKCGFTYPDVVFDEIVNIEFSEAETYDLSVEKLEKLTANGCSVHNCSAGGACSFCSEGNYCLPKGTLVKSTEGLKSIDEIKVGDKVVLLDKQLQVLDTVVVGEKPTITFELSNHQKIKVANTHLILTIENGHLVYKRAFNLRDGDFIAYERSESFGSNRTDKAYLVGAVIGDGLFYPELNLVKVYSPISEVEEMKVNLGWMSCSKHSNTIMRFGKQTKELAKELTALGLTHETSKSKRVPKFFFNADKETVASLLRGMFDTDGTIKLDSKKRATISYSTVSEKLKDDLVALLSMFGIRAAVYEAHHKAHYKTTGEEVGASHGWDITIFGNENVKRFKSVGFGLRSKQKKLEESVEAAFEVDYVPTFEERVKDWYHQNKEFNRQVRECNDSLRKVVNGWTKMHWLSKRHFEKSFDFLAEDIKNDYLEASQYEFVQIISAEEGPEEMMYDINVEDDHAYSLCGWVSHNTGGWVEKSHDQIIKESWEAKKYSAGYKYKPYSFNTNYLTDYKGMLAEWIKIYPKVTFINMRMEELGQDTDAMKMMKLVGSNRISAPMEGMSPRIQNNMLNKCLSQEALNAFMEEIVHQHLTDLKVGGIFTGYEEDEDFQWQCDFVDRLRKKAAEEGGSFPYRLKCCLTEDALTPIPGAGLVRQKDMVEGPVCGYYDSFITAVKPQGLCKIYKLVTVDGTVIKGTPEHPVLVDPKHPEDPTSFKFLKNLKKGDIIYGRLGTNAYGSLTISESLCKIIGWYLGDGYVNKHDNFKTCGFMFGPEEEGLYHELWDALVEEGLKPHVHNHQNKNVFAIRVHNAVFSRMLKDTFGHTAHGKRLGTILQMTKECQALILKYWFAADGTVTLDKSSGVSRIKLESVNFDILQDLKAVLANMGIGTSLHEHHSKCNGKDFKSSTIEIRQPWVEKFANEIGIAGVKGSKIITRDRKGTKSIVNGCLKMYVKESEQIADEVTYGFTVDSGTYVTNGIVSHNTPLVHYALTPIEYLERKSARKSYNGEHWLTDEWYEKFREHNIHFKVNGFRYSTFLEQSFIDLGRLLSDMIYRHFIKEHVKVYSLRSCATEDYIAELKSIIDEEGFFGDRDPEHYISPSHRIHIELMGSYVPRARRLVRHKNKGSIFDNEPDIRCLKTFDNAKTHCYHNCIKKDPLIIYNDVIMDEEGNLHGQAYDLNGCERCPTPKHRLGRLKRPTPQSKNSEDIIATPRIPQVQKVRFVIKRLSDYDILNPNNTAHTFMTKFLQLSDELLHNFHSIGAHNLLWQSAPQLKDYVCGYQVIDTMWSKNSIKLIRELIPDVNKHLKSIQVVSAQDILRDEKLLISDYNTWVFESTLPKELFDGASHSYKGQIKVEAQVQGFALTETTDSSLMSPIYQQVGGKVIGTFTIPAKYNPVLYLMGYVSQSKKTSEDAMVESTQFQCVMAARETKMPCRACSSENAMISLITGKPIPFGKKCLSKAILKQVLNK